MIAATAAVFETFLLDIAHRTFFLFFVLFIRMIFIFLILHRRSATVVMDGDQLLLPLKLAVRLLISSKYRIQPIVLMDGVGFV